MCKFQDLEYCKTDLVASKGVVFCKFQKSSSALQALEDVNIRGMVRNTPGMCLHEPAIQVCPYHLWADTRRSHFPGYYPWPQVAGYKVKCMLAEPKTKRRAEGSPQDTAQPLFGHLPQVHVINIRVSYVCVTVGCHVCPLLLVAFDVFAPLMFARLPSLNTGWYLAWA